MRIESVTAHAFGPLTDQRLSFGPGMNVVCGQNESAKSSWHAATFAALCGRKRGKGRPSKEDARFAELHRPWDGTSWTVSAVLALDDGRRIEIRQDLDGKVDCRATDLALGRDVSSEILFDGSPDGSVWLGLNRRSFAATASIGQTQLLAVLGQAEGLQQHLQQAAATAGTDATAAGALACLETFRRDHVGRDAANSTRPLRRALDRVATAQEQLRRAQAGHADYVRLAEEAEQGRERAAAAEQRAVALDARAELLALAAAAADEAARTELAAQASQGKVLTGDSERRRLERRLERARELTAEVGSTPPAPHVDRSVLTRNITTALAAYRSVPPPQPSSGPDVEALREQLAATPVEPRGDRAVHALVREAARNYDSARALADRAAQRPPSSVAAGSARLHELNAEQLRDTAATLAGLRSALTRRPDPAVTAAAVEQAQQRRDDLAAEFTAAEQQRSDAELAARAAGDQLRAARSGPPGGPAGGPPARPGWVPLAWVGAALLLALAVVVAVAGAAPVGGALVTVAVAAVLAGVALVAGRGATSAPAGPEPAALATRERAVADASAALSQATDALAQARDRLSAAEQTLAAEQGRALAAEQAAGEAKAAHDTAVAELTGQQLPTDPHELRTLAADADSAQRAAAALSAWQDEHDQTERDVAMSGQALLAAIAARERAALPPAATSGEDTSRELDPAAALDAYEGACAVRASAADLSARRPDLEEQLKAREAALRAESQARRRHAQACADLWEAAQACGLLGASSGALTAAGLTIGDGSDPDAEPADLGVLCELLEQEQRAAEAAESDRERQQAGWAELISTLDGSSLDELAAQVAELAKQHEQDAQRAHQDRQAAAAACEAVSRACTYAGTEMLDAGELRALRNELTSQAAQARREMTERVAAASDADGVRSERARTLLSVPEAEEELDAAKAELERVRRLDATLATTMTLLSRAQERVHRDIAPILADTLRSWLPLVTDGRYTDATVDPATLQVQVCGPNRLFRRAELLSHGTAEQVYLLMRAALTQHLTAGHDNCPLLLDDVTVQADSVRTTQILTLLHKLSDERQVIVFAQQEQVAEWAREQLAGDRDRVIELTQVPLS
jgi:exonuclease SbcC